MKKMLTSVYDMVDNAVVAAKVSQKVAQAKYVVDTTPIMLLCDNVIQTIQFGKLSIPVVNSPYLTWASAAPVAGAKMNDGNAAIIIDDDFKELSENAQMFIMIHELGHIMDWMNHGYRNLDEIYPISKLGVVDAQEAENFADMVAAYYLGKKNAIAAIREFVQLLTEKEYLRKNPKYHTSFTDRIEFIKNLDTNDATKAATVIEFNKLFNVAS